MTNKPESATVNSLGSEPTPYVFRGSTSSLRDRKGQPIRVTKYIGLHYCEVEFEDGFKSVVPRHVVRRKREVQNGEAKRGTCPG